MNQLIRKTVCNRDCPDVCSIRVTIEDGKAVRLQGDPDDPITRGFLCERTTLFLHRQYAADRFVSPMIRRNGDLEPAGWDEALDLIAKRMKDFRKTSGPASILHYLSGGSLGILKPISNLLFEKFGPVSLKRGDICSGAGEGAQELDFGDSESNDIFDLYNAKTIVVWGKNPHVSSPHLLPILTEAKRRGAVVLGMDPVRTRIASLCDQFIMPRPGGDFALAMAMARWIIEHDRVHADATTYCDNLEAFRGLALSRSLADWAAEADVSPDDIARMAEVVGSRGPVSVLVGWGLGRRKNGGMAVRAIDALGAITGNVGIPGGCVSYNFRRRHAVDHSFIGGLKTAPRSFSEARLGKEILEATDPEIRMIWVTAGNPLAMLPDSATVRAAFKKAEFVVVVDTHPTDTTDVADVVLPTLTLLEDSDVLGSYGHHYLRISEQAIEPPGGALHELEIWQRLAGRLGIAEAMAGSLEDWKRRVLAPALAAGVDYAELKQRAVHSPLAPLVLYEGRKFRTANGRANLVTERSLPPPAVSAEFPLTLLAVSTPKGQSSQMIEPAPPGPATVTIHPSIANGYQEGDRVRLESRHNSLDVVIHLSDAVRPDVALMEKGGMLRDGRCANLLIEAHETDLGGGAAYYDEPVRLTPINRTEKIQA